MKRWRMAAGVCLVVCTVVWASPERRRGAHAQAGSNDNAAVETELVKMERQWLEAEVRGDVAALDKMFAADFIGTGPGGNILFKDDIVPSAEHQGQGRFPSAALKESVVRVYGTTAVVMGLVAVGEATPPGQLRFTKVYLNHDGRWICVAAHLARLPHAEE